MKRWIALLLLSALAIWQVPAQAQGRAYSQAELDALLAPVALYPDPVLSHVLVASTYPDDLRDAAAWSRANSHLAAEDAVRAADPMLWHPSAKALVAFPDLLARMDESPQWTADLGAAFLEQEPYVMDTVQSLRRRAQASGYLQSNPQQQVYEQGQAIAVYPVQPQVVYVPYYDPYVVYGPWSWAAYRPVYWRPWFARPAVFVSTHFFVSSVDWRRRHVVRQGVQQHARPHQPQHWRNDGWRPREAHRARTQPAAPVTIHNHAHPVRPIVDSVRIPQPAIVHNQAQVVRPMVDPVRTYQQQTSRAPRPVVESVRIRPQPAAQTHRPQVRSEFPHAARPMGPSGQVRQPQHQAEQRGR
jgi:hypothetical protein